MATAPSPKTPRKPTSDPATKYATDVIAGLSIAGPLVRAACARHLDDLKYAKARGLTWDLEAATRAILYFRDVLLLNRTSVCRVFTCYELTHARRIGAVTVSGMRSTSKRAAANIRLTRSGQLNGHTTRMHTSRKF
jgi:hypothetical protein